MYTSVAGIVHAFQTYIMLSKSPFFIEIGASLTVASMRHDLNEYPQYSHTVRAGCNLDQYPAFRIRVDIVNG